MPVIGICIGFGKFRNRCQGSQVTEIKALKSLVGQLHSKNGEIFKEYD